MKIKVGARLAGFGKLGGWSIVCAAAIFAMALFGCASRTFNPSPVDLSFEVMKIKGQARWKTGTNDWQPLVKNLTVHAGTEIETAQNSHVDLLLIQRQGPDQSTQTASSLNRTDLRHTEPPLKDSQGLYSSARHDLMVRIWENTRLALPQLERIETKLRRVEVGKVTLDLQAGHIFASLSKLPPGAAFEVRMPTCSASVRGTTFDANVDGIVKVLAGSVLVTGTNFSQLVEAQQMFDSRTKVLSPLSQCEHNGLPTIGVKHY